jgi:hypothetical protein
MSTQNDNRLGISWNTAAALQTDQGTGQLSALHAAEP